MNIWLLNRTNSTSSHRFLLVSFHDSWFFINLNLYATFWYYSKVENVNMLYSHDIAACNPKYYTHKFIGSLVVLYPTLYSPCWSTAPGVCLKNNHHLVSSHTSWPEPRVVFYTVWNKHEVIYSMSHHTKYAVFSLAI